MEPALRIHRFRFHIQVVTDVCTRHVVRPVMLASVLNMYKLFLLSFSLNNSINSINTIKEHLHCIMYFKYPRDDLK